MDLFDDILTGAPTCTNEVQSFQSNGDGSGGLNQSTSLPLPTSEILRTTDISNKFDYVSSSIPFSEDNRSFAAVIPSQPDSLNAMPSEAVVHNGTRDWPSSFGKSAAEVTFNEAGVVNEDDSHTKNSRSETQEGADLNRDCPIDDVFDYQSMKSGTCPTSEIPMHEELTNSTDSRTLADFLHQDVTGEKEDANERKYSLRTHRRSSITGLEDKGGKTSSQLRKQVARKPDNNSMNDDDDDLDPPYDCNSDELEEYDDEYKVDYSSKKKRASTSSKKRSVVKNGKTSQKRKRANDDLEKTIKEPPKKLSHSTRQRKRCVDKALLDDDELVLRNLPIRDIILITDCRERLAKKEATTSKTSSINQSGGDFLHEAGANNEDEIFGSEDPNDEKITPTSSLFNYQLFTDKAPRAKWSKQETEEFYEAVSDFGTEFTMIQLLFPKKTRRQVKLKYKKEERQHPLQLFDAENNRAKDLSCFKSVIESQQQTSTKVEQDASRDASDFMQGEEVEGLTPGTNSRKRLQQLKQDSVDVKDQEDSVAFHSPEQSDDSDDDLQRWSQYKSDY